MGMLAYNLVSFRRFLRSCLSVILKRDSILVVMNVFYFGSIVVGAFLAYESSFPFYREPVVESGTIYELGDSVWLGVNIFVSNLFLSAFFFTTLTGLVFFGLPLGFLFLRAMLWGTMLDQLSTSQFLVALPTLVLEGEAYVFASLCGIVLGLSWLKPTWVFEGESLSRWNSLKMALKECLHVYVFAALLLFVAAVVEVATLFIFG